MSVPESMRSPSISRQAARCVPTFPVLVLVLAAGCGSSTINGTPRSHEVDEAAPPASTLADAVATAQSGDTINLPAGIFPGGLTLPPGVSIHGAGYRQTIIDARNLPLGFHIKAGGPAEIADLTIWSSGATRSGILVQDAHRIVLRRLRVNGGLNGIDLAKVDDGRVENVICDGNRYGIVVSGGNRSTVVNCTIARCTGTALSGSSGTGVVAFNNVFADCETGVVLGASARDSRVDHNLYFSQIVGRRSGSAGCRLLGDWQAESGQDDHSVQLPLVFRDPARGDFRPIERATSQEAPTLSWSLDRWPTTDWGAAELSGAKPPETDIDGSARVERVDVGACEVAPPVPSRPADGEIAVGNDNILNSAEVFTPEGRKVADLFHDLPLPVGHHPVWFPTRDLSGRPISTGTYEFRFTTRPPRHGGALPSASGTSTGVFTLDEPAARALAALPPPLPPASPWPVPPILNLPRLSVVPSLNGELDLDAWRNVCPEPQVVLTPESARGSISGPRNASALVRLGYVGENLCLQVLVFDDVPAFREAPEPAGPVDRDGLTVRLDRLTFTIERTEKQGVSVSVRSGRSVPTEGADTVLSPDQAPRRVTVLKDAKRVTERRLIEAIFGVDLAGSPVLVYECVLPVGGQDGLPTLASGRAFRLGLLVGDRDPRPGRTADDTGVLVWPATFGPRAGASEMGIILLD